MIGDALVKAIWKAQNEHGRPLVSTEMASILRCPVMSVRLQLHTLLAQHPYPIQTIMAMKREGTGFVWTGHVHYYVTRQTVYPDVVSGRKL